MPTRLEPYEAMNRHMDIFDTIADVYASQVYPLEVTKDIRRFVDSMSPRSLKAWQDLASRLSENNYEDGNRIVRMIQQPPSQWEYPPGAGERLRDVVRQLFREEFHRELEVDDVTEVYRCLVRIIWVLEIMADMGHLPPQYLDCVTLFSHKEDLPEVDYSRMPPEVRYITPYLQRYGHLRYESDIAEFLEDCSEKECQQLRALKDKLIESGDIEVLRAFADNVNGPDDRLREDANNLLLLLDAIG